MAANAVSKVLGALFKIPLTYILAEDGMAVYNTAFSVYIMFLSFVISGIPTAVSRSVAQADERRACVVTDAANWVLRFAGAAASAALYLGADFFAAAMKEESAAWAIRAIAPSVLFVAMGAGCKSYFHGASDMTAPAVSQVVEAFVKLAAGYVLAAYMCERWGRSMGALGAALGVTAGELVASAILVIGYLMRRSKADMRHERGERRRAVREIMAVALPILATAVMSNAISLTDTSILRNRLIASGLSEERARFLYGAYTGYAMTVFNLPVGILGTIGISTLSAAANAVKDGNCKNALRPTNKALELTLFISIPCAVMMYIIPSELLNLLFHNDSSALMLKMLAPCVVILSVIQTVSAAIQACGRIILPNVVMICGAVIKAGLVWYLCAKSEYNIYGAAISSNIVFLLVALTDLAILRKITGAMPKLLSIGIKPAIAAAVMAGVVIYAKKFTKNNMLSIAALCMTGGAVYMLIMCIFNNKRKRSLTK